MLSTHELDQFVSYARPRIESSEAESLVQLLVQWQSQQEQDQAINDIRAGLDDVQAGRVTPSAEVFEEIRQKLGLSKCSIELSGVLAPRHDLRLIAPLAHSP